MSSFLVLVEVGNGAVIAAGSAPFFESFPSKVDLVGHVYADRVQLIFLEME